MFKKSDRKWLEVLHFIKDSPERGEQALRRFQIARMIAFGGALLTIGVLIFSAALALSEVFKFALLDPSNLAESENFEFGPNLYGGLIGFFLSLIIFTLFQAVQMFVDLQVKLLMVFSELQTNISESRED